MTAASPGTLTPLQQAALVIKQLRARVDSLEGRRREPIAICGLSCRFPGAASPEAYWQLLEHGRDAIGDIPSERWDMDTLYDPDPQVPGRMYTRRAGLLSDIDRFDPYFFGISPREAEGMDPQQRLLLEVAWEAIEDAGVSPERLRGTRGGVFVGISSSDFMQHLLRRGAGSIDHWLGTGSAPSAAVGRLSYMLGLEGPSLAIDSACSSSLVAVHQACHSLRQGECDLALAGGVNLILTPELSVAFCKAGMLSPDGRCKTFDADADGYVRAEGCGMIVLKRLSDALSGGDRILALVRGSAVNQDGRSSGLTVPNGPAQERVVREALAAAGVTPAEVGFVEAHGTGTSIGDPIEVQALAAAIGEGHSTEHPLLIGAVKSQIGHVEAGAGIAGLIKLVLSIQHGRLPGQLHFATPNPHIPWASLPLRVVAKTQDWPAGPRIAGVSAFGFSGTNAHVVLSEAPPASTAGTEPAPPRCMFLQLSARDEPALRELAGRYVAWLREHADADLADLCYTAAQGRAHWEERLALPAQSTAQLADDLADWLAGGDRCLRGRVAMGHADSSGLFSWSSDDATGLARACADYVAGHASSVGASGTPRRKIGLPTYPFQRERYWPIDAEPAEEGSDILHHHFDLDAASYLSEHRVRGSVVLPAALLVELARQAVCRREGDGPATLADFRIEQAVVLGDSGRQVLVAGPGDPETDAAIEIRSRAPGLRTATGWIVNATGRSVRVGGQPAPGPIDRATIEARCTTDLEIPGFYAGIAASGIDLGPAFRTLTALRSGDGEALAILANPTRTGDDELCRTVFLDGALQSLGALLPAAADGMAYLPVSIERIDWLDSGSLPQDTLYCHASLRAPAGSESAGLTGDLTLFDASGTALLRASGLCFRRMATEQPAGRDRRAQATDALVHDFRVALGQPGSIDNLHLVPAECPPPGPGQVQVEVRASGINFRDLVGVLGMLPGYRDLYGGECAGRVVQVGSGVDRFRIGDAVVGFAEGCLAARVNVDARQLVALPTDLADAAAVTLPVSFVTAWHALRHLSGLGQGERVLIHSAAGGLGMAAVQVAQYLGAEIFATAHPSKWAHLRDLGIRHLADSHAPDFAETIADLAGPRGIDVVLNSLPAERIADNLALLARNGRFIEVGQLGIWSAEQMASERPDVAYHVIRLDRMLAETPELAGERLGEIIERVRAGRLQPLPHQVFSIDQVREAFRVMQRGRHIGKLVLTVPAEGIRPDNDAPRSTPLHTASRAQRDHYIHYVRETTARILGWSAGRLPDPRTGFIDLGLDSLMAVELRNRIQSDLGPAISLSSTIGFDYPTIEALGKHLAAQLVPSHTDDAMLDTEVAAQVEPIAIVGMACRFPGGVSDPEAYWQMLREGVDAVTELPTDRTSLAGLYGEQGPETAYAHHAALLDHIDLFDNDFFGIAPREAVNLDPQQRLLLETTWESLEHAGIAADRLAGTRTGVFVGICSTDYKDLFIKEDGESMDAYFATGTAGSVASGRISYLLGLHGPSMTLDTACSSALVAVHEACQSLRAGDCGLAVAGGANVLLSTVAFRSLGKARMLSATGHCHTFDAAADGYVRGEGVGIVVLRRLSDALEQGDRVLAVIRGSAVNQDGRSNGLTAPNGLSQQAVIRQALQRAGAQPAEVGYLEAHGTGTPLGDPIEVQAASAVLGEGRAPDRPLLIGSVKANIGHGEGAAGISSLLKLVLAIRHGELPPQIQFATPNPKIDWERLPVRVVSEPTPWPAGPRLGGVSAFGFSGTNVHMVIGEAPVPAASKRLAITDPCVLCLSARDAAALRALAERYLGRIEADPELDLAELCHGAASGRRHWEERLAVVADSIAQLGERLATWVEQGAARGVRCGRAIEIESDRTAATGEDIDTLASAYVRGAPARWCSDADKRPPPARIDLPTYPFQRQRFWLDPVGARSRSGARDMVHPLLGAQSTAPDRYTFEGILRADRPAWLEDHRVLGAVVFPAAGLIEMALAAARIAWGEQAVSLERFTILQPLVPPAGRMVQTQTILSPDPLAPEQAEFRVLAHVGDAPPKRPGDWTLHASGQLTVSAAEPIATTPEQAGASCQRALDIEDLYRRLAEQGLDYGPTFQGLREVRQGSEEAFARIEMPNGASTEYRLHPVLLDACLQAIAAARHSEDDAPDQVLLPTAIERFTFWRAPAGALSCHVRMRDAASSGMSADLLLWDDTGQPLGRVEGLSIRPAARRSLHRLLGTDVVGSALYRLSWRPMPRPTEKPDPDAAGLWWLIGDGAEVGGALIDALGKRGQRCLILNPDEAFGDLPELDTPPRGIVHLGALGWPAVDPDAQPSLAPEVQRQFAALVAVLRDLASAAAPAPRLWFITAGAQAVTELAQVRPEAAALWGLAKGIGQEEPRWCPTAIDLDDVESVGQLVDELLAPDREDRIAYRAGIRYVARLDTLTEAAEISGRLAVPEGDYRLHIEDKGTLENLRLAPIECPAPGPGEIQVNVRAAGLNFRDVLDTLGVIGRDLGPLGGECAGIVHAVGSGVTDFAVGDAVMGLAPGCFGNRVNVAATLMARQPARLSAAQAATIPVTFATAWLGLHDVGGLKRGDRILIHAAAGGVGLAAIQIARHLGAEIYATASPGKWEYLRGLGVTRIANSRSLDFAETIRALSGGRGIDIVLNSLSGDFIPRTLGLLVSGGRFIEIGKRDIWSPDRMHQARSDVDYHVVALDDVTHRDPPAAGGLVRHVMALLDEGALQAPRHQVFDLTDAPRAFRWMQQGRHIGKIVLRTPPDFDALAAQATYLVTGGLRGLGLASAERLVARGARHLVLLGRSAPDAASLDAIAALEAQGAHVRTASVDVADAAALAELLDRVRTEMPPLRGVIHCAGVLDDGALAQQTWERFERVWAAKAQGAWNLHRLTRDDDLDLFVLYSSVAAVLGSAGQSNYAAANAYLDGLALHRRALGLPATSIDWGPWDEIGMGARLLARQGERSAVFADRGLTPIPVETGLTGLETVVRLGSGQTSVLLADLERYTATLPGGVPPLLANRVRTAPGGQQGADAAAARAGSDLLRRLHEVPSGERLRLLTGHIAEETAKVLGKAPASLTNPRAGFLDLGMDSLMAVELRNRLQPALGEAVELPATLIFDFPTIERLAAYAMDRIFPTETAPPVAPPPTPAAEPADSVDALSDDELMAALDQAVSGILDEGEAP